MKMTAVAVVFAIVAIATAVLAWQKNQALVATKLELTETTSRLQKAEARIKPLEASVETLRKESVSQQQTLEQVRADYTSARVLLDAERDTGARLRDELAKTKELLAVASKPRPPQAMQPGSIPMLVRPVPTRVAPAGSGSAVGVGVPAR